MKNSYEVPIVGSISALNDKGSPAVLAMPEMHPIN